MKNKKSDKTVSIPSTPKKQKVKLLRCPSAPRRTTLMEDLGLEGLNLTPEQRILIRQIVKGKFHPTLKARRQLFFGDPSTNHLNNLSST